MGNSAGSGNFYRMGQAMGPDQLDTSMADAFAQIGGHATEIGIAMAAEKKAEAKKIKDAKNKAGDKISQAFIDMGPELKNLGQESYAKAQDEAEMYRERYWEALQSEDIKEQQNIMVEINEWKARHEGDADALKTLVETWEPDEDGDRAVSTDAMTQDDIAIMENFIGNESKRVVYGDDNTMMYEWDVPVMDGVTGQPKIDEFGNPVTEPKRYSLQELQDKVILKDTVNGVKLIDYGQELKESFTNNPDNPPTAARIKEKVSSIIPKDEKKIRDWLHGNPADQPGLDVHGYLLDLMERDFNTFTKLGIDISQIKDTNDDGEVNSDDVPRAFKDDLIKKVLEVEDLEISHDIVTEIYAKHLQYDMLGEPNKDYRTQDETSILGSEMDSSVEAKAKRMEALTKLKMLGDPKSPIFDEIKAMSPKQIANHLGFASINSKIFNEETRKLESISNYISEAKGVKGEEKSADDLIEKYSG